MKLLSIIHGVAAAITAVVATAAFAAPNRVEMRSLPYATEPTTTIPVASSDSALAAARTLKSSDLKAFGGVMTGDRRKALGDNDTVGWFRPLAACRLLDTRNLGAPVGGPAFSPNTTRTISPQTPAPANKCNIPSSNVLALQVVFSTQNYTVNSGGYLTLKAPGAPIASVNTVYNLGAQWSAASAVVPTNSFGEFDVYVNGATAEVIVDVTGYYSDLDNVPTGINNFDLVGNTGGDIFEVVNSGTGRAITASAPNGVALSIGSGAFQIVGAGTINSTSRSAFTHKVTAANLCGATGYTIIDNTLLNNEPGAQVMITPRQVFDGGTDPLPANTSISAFYQTTTCGTALPAGVGYWFVHLGSGAHAVGMAYNILIIK